MQTTAMSLLVCLHGLTGTSVASSSPWAGDTHSIQISLTGGLDCILDCSRLYYLFRGKVSMQEQDIFHYLYWFSPTISVILTALQALENAIFFPKTPLMVPYSSCAKTPFPMESIDELVTLKVI